VEDLLQSLKVSDVERVSSQGRSGESIGGQVDGRREAADEEKLQRGVVAADDDGGMEHRQGGYFPVYGEEFVHNPGTLSWGLEEDHGGGSVVVSGLCSDGGKV
jgi:hypothetical protein